MSALKRVNARVCSLNALLCSQQQRVVGSGQLLLLQKEWNNQMPTENDGAMRVSKANKYRYKQTKIPNAGHALSRLSVVARHARCAPLSPARAHAALGQLCA